MSKLDSQIKKITTQMSNKNTEKDVVAQMEEFLPVMDNGRYHSIRATCVVKF